jgi:hypothetical protein
VSEAIERHNRMIERANERLRQLREAGVNATGRLIAQGVEITIERPSFRGREFVERSYEIIIGED